MSRRCPTCGGSSMRGDNYGFSCMNCGTALQGYGCGGHAKECIHDWYGEPHMKIKYCTYCQREMKNEKYDPRRDNWRDCPDCGKQTEHKLVLYNPDYPGDGEAWQCKTCNNLTDIFEG
jgi:predicted RNA-binding Zn-ribbon protein involved in translation (DUF1610 family)